MLKIRMQRTGRINSPSYRVVVVEHTESPKTGNIVEKVGTYDPKTKERVLNAERIKYWMSVGAEPSATMHNMLVSLGILNAKKINVLPKYKEPVKGEAVAETPVVEETKEAPVPETLAEEVLEKEAAPTPEGVGVPTSPLESVGKKEA